MPTVWPAILQLNLARVTSVTIVNCSADSEPIEAHLVGHDQIIKTEKQTFDRTLQITILSIGEPHLGP